MMRCWLRFLEAGWLCLAWCCVASVAGLLSASPAIAQPIDPVAAADLPRAGEAGVHGEGFTGNTHSPQGRLIVLGFGGDLGFSGKDQPLVTTGAIRHGQIIPWSELTSGLAPLLEADATFANLETVITNRADLVPVDRSFNFAASPEGVAAVARAGIDVLATANNHAADYGAEGIMETLRHLEAARAYGLKAHAGLGVGSDRYRSDVFHVGDVSVGIAAIGKGVNPAEPDGPGQPLQARPVDFERVGLSLAGTGAQIRVLSVHYGEELDNTVSDGDRKRFRAAVDGGRATIVFGHHSHVAAGIERRGNALIFYGLGNFLHAGTQNMARYDECRDFGLYARAYMWAEPGKDPILRAVEVIPLKDMYEITKPFPMPEAKRRIEILNSLSSRLATDGGQPLLLVATGKGSGLACMQSAVVYGDELEARCAMLEKRPTVIDVSADRVSSACRPLPDDGMSAARAVPQSKSQPGCNGPAGKHEPVCTETD